MCARRECMCVHEGDVQCVCGNKGGEEWGGRTCLCARDAPLVNALASPPRRDVSWNEELLAFQRQIEATKADVERTLKSVSEAIAVKHDKVGRGAKLCKY